MVSEWLVQAYSASSELRNRGTEDVWGGVGRMRPWSSEVESSNPRPTALERV